MSRYFARSASDRTEEWPFWFVADKEQGGLNVTNPLAASLGFPFSPGAVFATRKFCEKIARIANERGMA